MKRAAQVVQGVERAPAWNFGRFVWHDIVTSDLQRSRRFYAGLFGWRYQDLQVGADRYLVIIGPGGPQGGLMPAAGRDTWAGAGQVMAFLSVADVDGAARAAVAGGGQVLSAPFEVPGMGRLAVLADGGGARFSVIHSAVGDAPPAAPRAGMFCWEQLHSRRPLPARRFYQEVVGWQISAAPGTHEVEQFTPGPAGNTRAAASLTAVPSPPDGDGDQDGDDDQWLSYVLVPDLAAARDRVRQLGGKVRETLRAGRIGILTVIEDDLGIRLGLLAKAGQG
jgi:predicted enzyme related to lactoylglutathione lyase